MDMVNAPQTMNSFVFFDLETTGLPRYEMGRTKIIEIAMVSVRRQDLLSAEEGSLPRVLHKIVHPICPRKWITEESIEMTCLTNESLEFEENFNRDLVDELNKFLSRLQPPICLIAHNGNNFDFPLLKAEVDWLKMELKGNLFCCDSMLAFARLMPKREVFISSAFNIDRLLSLVEQLSSSDHSQNELINSPTKRYGNGYSRRLEKWDRALIHIVNEITPRRTSFKKGDNYLKLRDIHEKFFGLPPEQSHRAEDDILTLIKCTMRLGSPILEWFDENSMYFSQIKPMWRSTNNN